MDQIEVLDAQQRQPNPPQSRAVVELVPAPLPRRIRLTTLRHVRSELAQTYRGMVNGSIDHADGTKRAFVLQALAKVIEVADLEQRLTALEERQKA